MIRMIHRSLAVALAAALGLSLYAPIAAAQQDAKPKTAREQREARRAELGKGKQETAQAEATPQQYPNATRVPPDAKASGKMVKHLQALQELFEKQDSAGVIAKAEEVAAMPAANAYEKSFAYSMAGNAAADLDDQAKAADYFKRAVDANGLDNNGHYGTMFNLAVIQFGNEKYADALATIDRFLAETRSDKPEHQAFRAGVLANMERHDEAAKIYQELVAKNPTDKRLLMNAVAALQNADKFDEANALLEGAYKRGMLTEERELRSLYIGYMNAERFKDAEAVVEDGVAKGIFKPGPDLGKAYVILAQNAFYKDDDANAIRLYQKGAPMTADGEAYLNLARVLEGAGRKADAKAAAQKALDKGLKKPEDARAILAR